MTIGQAIIRARNMLADVSGGDATADAREFVSKAAEIDVREIALHAQTPLSSDAISKLDKMVSRRNKREPTQYITGRAYFMGREFICDSRGLIPRFETEMLVQEALNIAREHNLRSALDMCAGSGCIAISLWYGSLDVWACDASGKALALAEENAALHGAEIHLRHGDLFNPLPKGIQFDIIVSNPPYVESGQIDLLSDEVRAHEPRMALDGGADGLSFYRRIVGEAKDYLAQGGYLMLEVGFNQAEKVAKLMEGNFSGIRIINDIRNVGRIVTGKRKD